MSAKGAVKKPTATKPVAKRAWSLTLAGKAIKSLTNEERQLVARLADARGRRVPMSELVAAFGLPPAPSLAQDFPGLSAFCAKQGARGPELPVIAEGTDSDGWYWMSPTDANAFRRAFKKEAAE